MSFDPELIAKVQRVSTSLSGEIEAARKTGIAAIRGIEKRLVEALDGTLLRGLPNLAGDLHNSRFAAARVRGKREQPLEAPGPQETMGPSVLVITAEGKLHMACRTHTKVHSAPAQDVEFMAEDLANYTTVLTDILNAHIVKANDLRANFANIRKIAEQVKEAIEQ